ncbi:PDZ domain-containing protein 4 [Mauremys mutica]|uniref:PDZ domain-containing protein 4 n=1 Tax=Mauremys mutica TaxID=74926 RepID=UPI001D147323|nr:PDZ domain-containing protein 4 [Mauremys mutica]
MGCNMCLAREPEEQYKVMLQVNGKPLARLSQEQTLEALRCSKEPLVIQVVRRSPRARGGGEGALPGDPATLVDSGTQTDISFEHLLALGRRRPPSPPAGTLETFGLPEIPPFGHEYYDPVEFMGGGPPETERAEELEYEEVELYKSSHRDKLGLTVCYRTDDEDDVGIYVGEVNPNSIAAKDGRIREGDRIVQINGVQVQDREEAVAILTQEQQTNISLLLARPETELSRRWKDSDREDFLDAFGSDHEGEMRPRATPGQQPAVAPEPPSAGPPLPPLTHSQELDSGVGRTDESTRNEESSEHDLLGDEPPSSAGTPAPQRRPAPLPARDFPFGLDSRALAGGEGPGLTDAEYERYQELLELRGHLASGPGPGGLPPGALPPGLDLNRNRVALLEEELRHLQFKCRNILRAQKMQRLRERCLQAWLLEEEGGPAPAGEGPPPAPLADITEVPERSEKDSTSAYNTGESCRSTPLLQSPGPGPRAEPPPKPGRLRRPREEWKGRARGEGARRPGRDRLLKARALKIREERSGMTTDDDAVSEMKMGRYWSREERKQQLLRAREQRRRRELMLQSRLDWQREGPGAPDQLSILALSHRKSLKKRSRRILDNWMTIQEMLAHGARSADGHRLYNPLLSVTTV